MSALIHNNALAEIAFYFKNCYALVIFNQKKGFMYDIS